MNDATGARVASDGASAIIAGGLYVLDAEPLGGTATSARKRARIAKKSTENNMSYENAAATKLLATNCVICGRALVDATSVELGVGPECRKHVDGDIADDTRKTANEQVFKAGTKRLLSTHGAGYRAVSSRRVSTTSL